MKKITLLLLLATLIGFGACKKDNNTATPKTKKELLTAKVWKQTARTITPAIEVDGKLENDLFAHDDACDKDDLYRYKADNTFSYEEGATKCDPTSPDIYDTGTWTFSSDETKLILVYKSNDSYVVNLLELTESTLKVSSVEDDNGVTYTTTTTYTAQ